MGIVVLFGIDVVYVDWRITFRFIIATLVIQ